MATPELDKLIRDVKNTVVSGKPVEGRVSFSTRTLASGEVEIMECWSFLKRTAKDWAIYDRMSEVNEECLPNMKSWARGYFEEFKVDITDLNQSSFGVRVYR